MFQSLLINLLTFRIKSSVDKDEKALFMTYLNGEITINLMELREFSFSNLCTGLSGLFTSLK